MSGHDGPLQDAGEGAAHCRGCWRRHGRVETTWTRWRCSRNRQRPRTWRRTDDRCWTRTRWRLTKTGTQKGESVPLSAAEQATICKKQEDGMILEMIVLVLHQIFTQLPLLIHLCQTNFNHNLMFESVVLHWCCFIGPTPKCPCLDAYSWLSCVCVDKSRPRLHLPERHAEWRNCRQCYMDVVNKVGYKCPTRCTVGKLLCTQLAMIRLHCNHLPFSFFLLHLSTTFCSGWWRSSWYVGVIHRNADLKNHFYYLRMVFLTIFVLFAKLKAQFLDSLTKNLQENANLCTQKSYWFCARALFQKFVSPQTNSSGGKGLTREASATERHGNDRLLKRAVHTIR